MDKAELSSFKEGWFIGNFLPTLLKTDVIEVAFKEFRAGNSEARHKQIIATEATLVIEGIIEFDGMLFKEGQIAVIPPGEFTTFTSITDSKLVCIKWPSIPSDKVLYE
jgi:hypothetical protein